MGDFADELSGQLKRLEKIRMKIFTPQLLNRVNHGIFFQGD